LSREYVPRAFQEFQKILVSASSSQYVPKSPLRTCTAISLWRVYGGDLVAAGQMIEYHAMVGRRHWYIPLSFGTWPEGPSGVPVGSSRGAFQAHECVGGKDLRMRALGLFAGGMIPFTSRVLWIKGLQSQSLNKGDDSRIDHAGSSRASPKSLIPSSVTPQI